MAIATVARELTLGRKRKKKPNNTRQKWEQRLFDDSIREHDRKQFKQKGKRKKKRSGRSEVVGRTPIKLRRAPGPGNKPRGSIRIAVSSSKGRRKTPAQRHYGRLV